MNQQEYYSDPTSYLNYNEAMDLLIKSNQIERPIKHIEQYVDDELIEVEYGYYPNLTCSICDSEGIWLDMEQESHEFDICNCENCGITYTNTF